MAADVLGGVKHPSPEELVVFLVASDGRTDVGCDYMCIGMTGGSASFFHGTLRSLLPFLLLDFRAIKLSESEGWTLPSLSCSAVLCWLFKGSGACCAFRLLCQCKLGRTQGSWVIFWLSQIKPCAVLSALNQGSTLASRV